MPHRIRYNDRTLYLALPSSAILIGSLFMLLTGNVPESIRTSPSDQYIIVLLVMLIAGSSVTLGAHLMKGTQFSLNIEFAGLMSLVLSTVIYGLIVLTYGGFRLTVGGCLSIAFGVTCVVRMVEIRKKTKAAEEQRRLCLKHQIEADHIIARSENEGRPD